jgi:phosphohistidine phosphatase SixA
MRRLSHLPWTLLLPIALLAGSAVSCAGAPTVLASPSPATAPAPSGSIATAVPLDALRQGGLYIVMRHGPDAGKDASPVDLANCATQAALTDAGRLQLAATAADLSKLQIEVATVLASPYCRTLETARIVFGRSATAADALQRPVTPERTAVLAALLATMPATRSNVVLVTHRDIIKAALAVDPTLGEAFIVRPDGASRFTILARLAMDGWKIPG